MDGEAEADALAALEDLILGRGVSRGRHDLPAELLPAFFDGLARNGFLATAVASVDIEVGERVPAWLVRGRRADFGMVFWEVFTARAKRKLFGSQVRNAKGDWEIQIYPTSKELIHANPRLRESYDASRPIGLF